MEQQIGTLVLVDMLREFNNQRRLAERAMDQITDDEFFRTLGEDENSVAIIVKHVGGNLRSRWTEFLHTDGEKPDRNRDGEFEMEQDTRPDLMAAWHRGFATLEATLSSLEPKDLLATVRIRGEELSVVQALNRSLAHTSQHAGQIVLLAKHLRGREWQTISMPRSRRS